MSLPFFFADLGLNEGSLIEPGEETAKHIVQVLRMGAGERMILTNGRGLAAECTITSVSKRSCTLKVGVVTNSAPSAHHITIAISLLKNSARFEWFLEKAAENGINKIIPLICARTEKQRFRKDRAEAILISAMQQSQQSWITEVSDPIDLKKYLASPHEGMKYIAHCDDQERHSLAQSIDANTTHSTILIGPEGDFTVEEIALAFQNGFTPVTLGDTRLRTETAGLVAAILLRQLGK